MGAGYTVWYLVVPHPVDDRYIIPVDARTNQPIVATASAANTGVYTTVNAPTTSDSAFLGRWTDGHAVFDIRADHTLTFPYQGEYTWRVEGNTLYYRKKPLGDGLTFMENSMSWEVVQHDGKETLLLGGGLLTRL
jgi:hypothetical protein